MTNFVTRLQEELNKRLNPLQPLEAGSLMVFDSGKQTTFTGSGKIFNDFQRDIKLRYSGFASVPAQFYDYHFDDASLRHLKYDESFFTAPGKDVTSSTYT